MVFIKPICGNRAGIAWVSTGPWGVLEVETPQGAERERTGVPEVLKKVLTREEPQAITYGLQ